MPVVDAASFHFFQRTDSVDDRSLEMAAHMPLASATSSWNRCDWRGRAAMSQALMISAAAAGSRANMLEFVRGAPLATDGTYQPRFQ
jgi:hypothetical protein